MDWSNFDECFEKLTSLLRNTIDDKGAYLTDILQACYGYQNDIKLIVQRIETETKEAMILLNEELLQKKFGQQDGEKIMKLDEILRFLLVDIMSFFIFTRIFLDTLARIVGFCFGKAGSRLPWNMRKLVGHKKLMELDTDFAKGLKNRLLWMNTFVERRIEIEHYLGRIVGTRTRNGQFGFYIRGSRIRQSLGTDMVGSIDSFVGDVLTSLSKVVLYIHHKFSLSH